jgi:hypothetical protein
MKGAALGDMITQFFPKELEKLSSKAFYGLTHWNSKRKKRQIHYTPGCTSYLDGACGFNCMTIILKKIGFNLKFISETTNTTTYILEPLRK